MLTRDERRAVLFLSAVAAAGGLMRVVRAPAEPPGAPVVAPELSSGDIARQAQLANHAAELARPMMPGEVVDVDRAEQAELERLPRVGPALARRILDDREANGPFGSLEGLSRVPGMGLVMLKGLERKVTFSGVPTVSFRDSGIGTRQSGGRQGASGQAARGKRHAGQEVRAQDAAASNAPIAHSPLPIARSSCPPTPLPLNTATASELQCLPGLGPSLAAQIVTFRTAHGGFREVKDLQQVPGIGQARLARLSPLLRAP